MNDKIKIYTVYSIQNNINGKLYIGESSNFTRRKREHVNFGYKNVPKHLYSSMRIYGLENFTFCIIQEFETKKEALDSEVYWIAYFKANDNEFGYNKTKGGEAGFNVKNYEMTQERKLQLIDRVRGENSGCTDFKNEDILYIREEYNLSCDPNFVKLIAEKYSVTPSTIYHIIKGNTWKHLPIQGRTKKINKSEDCKSKISIKAKGNKRSIGSKNSMATLTEKDVIYIKKVWNKNPILATRKKLARKFKTKTSEHNIYQITSGRRWKHIK